MESRSDCAISAHRCALAGPARPGHSARRTPVPVPHHARRKRSRRYGISPRRPSQPRSGPPGGLEDRTQVDAWGNLPGLRRLAVLVPNHEPGRPLKRQERVCRAVRRPMPQHYRGGTWSTSKPELAGAGWRPGRYLGNYWISRRSASRVNFLPRTMCDFRLRRPILYLRVANYPANASSPFL
jgi:hypothetical protein